MGVGRTGVTCKPQSNTDLYQFTQRYNNLVDTMCWWCNYWEGFYFTFIRFFGGSPIATWTGRQTGLPAVLSFEFSLIVQKIRELGWTLDKLWISLKEGTILSYFGVSWMTTYYGHQDDLRWNEILYSSLISQWEEGAAMVVVEGIFQRYFSTCVIVKECYAKQN